MENFKARSWEAEHQVLELDAVKGSPLSSFEPQPQLKVHLPAGDGIWVPHSESTSPLYLL